MSLYVDFKKAAKQYDKSNACFYNGHFYKYSYILKQVDMLALYLKETIHLHQSATISLCLKNSLFALLMIYACNKLGVIVNLINTNLAGDQILYFDSLINSRMLFIDKMTYLENKSFLKNSKEKIVLIDSETKSLFKKVKFIKNRKEFNDVIPFNFKIKQHSKIDDFTIDVTDQTIAFTSPNEKFDERPYLACFTNGALKQALENQGLIFQKTKPLSMMLADLPMMSLPLFMSYFHAPICSNICICLDNIDNEKTYQKLLKKNKITMFSGDFSSFIRLFKEDSKFKTRLISHLDLAFIYNDTQRTYIYDLWEKECNIAIHNVPLISNLGLVETVGVFISCVIDKSNPHCFGEFLGDIEPHISQSKRKTKIGLLQILSKASMIGYYKSPNKSDRIIDREHGILTNFEGSLDIENRFYLSYSKFDKIPYAHNSPYLVNIKDMLMTIPGVKNLNITVALDKQDTMEFTVESDNKENNRITEQMTDYLNKQLKRQNIKYKITFKD